MREVDARGLSCPEPLMLTAEAIKSDSSPVKVLANFSTSENKCGEICKGSRKENNSRRNRRWICCCDRVK